MYMSLPIQTMHEPGTPHSGLLYTKCTGAEQTKIVLIPYSD